MDGEKKISLFERFFFQCIETWLSKSSTLESFANNV